MGEGNVKIWDLKYKTSEDLEIKIEEMQKTPDINNQWTKIDKVRETITVL